jgi:hypothetical protein
VCDPFLSFQKEITLISDPLFKILLIRLCFSVSLSLSCPHTSALPDWVGHAVQGGLGIARLLPRRGTLGYYLGRYTLRFHCQQLRTTEDIPAGSFRQVLKETKSSVVGILSLP